MLNRKYIGRDPADTERSGGGDACAYSSAPQDQRDGGLPGGAPGLGVL